MICCGEKGVKYTKGYPFWEHNWLKGELMATYTGTGKNNTLWVYKEYFGATDSVMCLNTGSVYPTSQVKCRVYKFSQGGMNVTVYSRKEFIVESTIVTFASKGY